MALERVSCSYRTEIQRARDEAQAGRYDQAIAILEAALSKLPADHLAARLSVLRGLVTLCRESDRFDRIARFREQLSEVGKKLVETCLQAARDGGLPEAELKAVLARLEESEKNRAHSGRGADWLSGATLFQGKDQSEDRAGSGGG
jgi:hypothetical protein